MEGNKEVGLTKYGERSHKLFNHFISGEKRLPLLISFFCYNVFLTKTFGECPHKRIRRFDG